jgi:Mycothiol maleylpyruvate isomerase N-terminal domain
MASAMTRKRELQAEESQGWIGLNGLIESLTPAQMEEPGYFREGWSVKDLTAHIGSWQAEAGQILEQIRYGTFRGDPVDVDAMNAVFLETNRDLPLSIVRAELFAARNRMLTEWNALPEITPKAEEWFVESGAAHYQEHMERLKAWVEELTAR